jgi:phosphoadenosine phosphosulfate reductase
MANLIRKNFPEGVLSFIGQRQYESSQRYEKGNVWRNPWVPGQIGASPIQNWPSLLVWLYLFQQKAEHNALYEKGLERIGCWLCPATDMGEFADIEKYSDQNERWQRALADHAAKKSLPAEWIALGLWRWKNLPKGMRDFLASEGIPVPDETAAPTEEKTTPEQKARLERFSCISDDTHAVRMKALNCMGCGICLSLCESNALTLEDGIIEVDPEKCTGCGKCLHPCVVVDFEPR